MPQSWKPRRGPLALALLSGLACLLLVGGVLYGTGTLQSWREERQLSRACGGILAAPQIRTVLGSRDVGAKDTGPDGTPASCVARARDGDSSMSLQVRWGSEDDAATRLLDRTRLFAYSAPVSPLGSWPGVLMSDQGRATVSLWLQCGNENSRGNDNSKGSKGGEGNKGSKANEAGERAGSLTVNARLDRGTGNGAGLSSAGRQRFAAAVVESAEKAADAAGCDHPAEGSLAGLTGSPRAHPSGLATAPGTCAGLRPLAARAARLGLGHTWAPPASGSAPVEDCVLTTAGDAQLPAYWMSAYYGPYAEDFTKRFAARVSGERGQEKDGTLTWATASCPGTGTGHGTGTRALFLLHGVPDNDTRTGAGKVPTTGNPPAFRADALSAFARQSAERHGCGDVKLP